ncbi:MAG: hypothetical protein V1855_01015 [bacterium]
MKKMRLAFALLLTFTVGYLYIHENNAVQAKRTRKTRRVVRRQNLIPLSKFLNGQMTYRQNPACQKNQSLVPQGRTLDSMMGSQAGAYTCIIHDLFLLINTNDPFNLRASFFNQGNTKRLGRAECLNNYTVVKLYSSPEMVDSLIAQGKIPNTVRDRALMVWLCFDYQGERYYLNDTNPPGRTRLGYMAVTNIMDKYE